MAWVQIGHEQGVGTTAALNSTGADVLAVRVRASDLAKL